MKPDAAKHNPDPAYLRGLIERAGMSQAGAAHRLGISPRAMRYYLASGGGRADKAPYTVQFCLEVLARKA